MTTLFLHDALPGLGSEITHRYSIQRRDERGQPVGVVCLFDVPETGDEERKAADAIFNAVNSHDDLLAATRVACAALRSSAGPEERMNAVRGCNEAITKAEGKSS